MTAEEYESLSYKNKFKRACKTALLVFLISAAVIIPASWLWTRSIERRQTLREAKNVVLNTNLLAMEFYTFDEPISDISRLSGMSRQAEERIRSFSGAEGEIELISWDVQNNCVAALNYRKGRFLVEYRLEEPESEDGSEAQEKAGRLEELEKTAVWNIYWRNQTIDSR